MSLGQRDPTAWKRPLGGDAAPQLTRGDVAPQLRAVLEGELDLEGKREISPPLHQDLAANVPSRTGLAARPEGRRPAVGIQESPGRRHRGAAQIGDCVIEPGGAAEERVPEWAQILARDLRGE